MMTFGVEQADYGLFGFVCIFCALALTIAEAFMLLRRRYLLVRPSMQVACLYTIFFMWPLVFFANNIEAWLPDPYAFLMVFVVFIASMLLWNLFAFQQTSREVWARATQAGPPRMSRILVWVFVLTATAAVIMTAYLREVPLTETGLVVALINPESSTQAREESLKLLDDEVIKYTFSIFASGIGPLLGVLLAQCIAHAAKARRYFSMAFAVLVFILVVISLSITGARSLAVSTLLAVLLSVLFRRGFRVRILPVVISVLLIVLPAIAITVFREGRGFEYSIFVEQISAVVVERMFVSPLEVGAAYVHLAQTHGYIGIDSIPKLAEMWRGSPGINVPNLIGLTYFYFGGADSINANAGFVATYFAYFGPLGALISVLCTLSLDSVLLCYRWMDNHLLAPCMAVLGAAMLALLSVDFTVILITYGFVIVPVIAIALSMLTRLRRTP